MEGEIQTKALAVSLRYEIAEKSLPEKSGDLTSGPLFTSNPGQVTVHVLLKPGLENFEHYFTSV